jgi:hypothetical protein
MIRIQLEHYITLGNNIATLRRMLEAPTDVGAYGKSGSKVFSPSEAVMAVMGQLRDACTALGLATARATIDQTMTSFQHSSQIEVMLSAVKAEMSNRLFLHIPADRAKYWETDDLLNEPARTAFPSAAQEVRSAGTSYACGLWNASVFHSMRAAEDGLAAICDKLAIERNRAEPWGNLIERIEKKLVEISKLPKASEEKRDNLQPLSELVIDLRLFKDAWRNQNSHTIVAYNDGNAHAIIHAVCRVLDALSSRGDVAAKKPA